jgi:hypothetical protein
MDGWMNEWMDEWIDGWMDSMSWKYIGGFRACPIVAKLRVPTSNESRRYVVLVEIASPITIHVSNLQSHIFCCA